MKSYLDCIPCFARQALQAVRFVTDDVAAHERVLRDVLRFAAEMDLNQTPPVMAVRIQRLVRELVDGKDPYREIKREHNIEALAMVESLRPRVEKSDDPLETAVRLAIAGNIIDFGPASQIDRATVEATIRNSLSAPLPHETIDELRQAIGQADKILYLADNAGEIAFDRLLIEQMPAERVTVAVKSHPVINDALMADAEAVGLCDLVAVVENGADAPGTMLDLCSEEFCRRFRSADLVIAKGQANYETLSDVPAEIFFLLLAKCPIIAQDIGYQVGDLVVKRGRGLPAAVA